MAVPAKKTSRAKTRQRRHSNSKLRLINHSTCKNCGKIKIPYCVCKSCGFYNLENILNIKRKENSSINKK